MVLWITWSSREFLCVFSCLSKGYIGLDVHGGLSTWMEINENSAGAFKTLGPLFGVLLRFQGLGPQKQPFYLTNRTMEGYFGHRLEVLYFHFCRITLAKIIKNPGPNDENNINISLDGIMKFMLHNFLYEKNLSWGLNLVGLKDKNWVRYNPCYCWNKWNKMLAHIQPRETLT